MDFHAKSQEKKLVNVSSFKKKFYFSSVMKKSG